VLDDPDPEGNETVALALTNLVGAGTVGLPSGHEVTIVDDDLGATVLYRRVFYNNSAWDGSDPGANVGDDNAVHPAPSISDPTHPGKELGKEALLPRGDGEFRELHQLRPGHQRDHG